MFHKHNTFLKCLKVTIHQDKIKEGKTKKESKKERKKEQEIRKLELFVKVVNT